MDHPDTYPNNIKKKQESYNNNNNNLHYDSHNSNYCFKLPLMRCGVMVSASGQKKNHLQEWTGDNQKVPGLNIRPALEKTHPGPSVMSLKKHSLRMFSADSSASTIYDLPNTY